LETVIALVNNIVRLYLTNEKTKKKNDALANVIIHYFSDIIFRNADDAKRYKNYE